MTNESVRNGQNGKGDGAAPATSTSPSNDWLKVDAEVRNGVPKVKPYYAGSVEEALKKARAEIGPEAILLHSRKTPIESRHLGPYEVVFSRPSEDSRAGVAARNSVDNMGSASGTSQLASMRLATAMTEMRREMREIQRALAGQHLPLSAANLAVTAHDLALNRLRGMGIEETIAANIVQAVSAGLGALSPAGGSPVVDASDGYRSALDAVLRAGLTERLRSAPPWNGRGATATIVALIGPPGAGKTTSLVKLALLRSKAATRPIHFISTDAHRIGAAEQLRTFASILGAGIDLVDSPWLLAQAIEANLHREMLLIDTPGLSGEDFALLNDLAEYLGRRNEIEKHLVLPATMRFRDMQRCIRRYEAFRADRLLFTHLDETDSFGPLYSAALCCDRPLSFLSGGQQIPEDLEEASEDKLMSLLFEGAGNETGEMEFA